MTAYTEYVKHVAMKVQELPGVDLVDIMRESIANSAPPCKVCLSFCLCLFFHLFVFFFNFPSLQVCVGPGKCRITGVTAENCIDIARCSSNDEKDKNGGRILVHPRFRKFFYMLWYSTKIEHVVRNYVRYWMIDKEGSVLELCKEFESNKDLIERKWMPFNNK